MDDRGSPCDLVWHTETGLKGRFQYSNILLSCRVASVIACLWSRLLAGGTPPRAYREVFIARSEQIRAITFCSIPGKIKLCNTSRAGFLPVLTRGHVPAFNKQQATRFRFALLHGLQRLIRLGKGQARVWSSPPPPTWLAPICDSHSSGSPHQKSDNDHS